MIFGFLGTFCKALADVLDERVESRLSANEKAGKGSLSGFNQVKIATLWFRDRFKFQMDVSLNGGTPKTPQNDHFYIVGKPIVFGYHHSENRGTANHPFFLGFPLFLAIHFGVLGPPLFFGSTPQMVNTWDFEALGKMFFKKHDLPRSTPNERQSLGCKRQLGKGIPLEPVGCFQK